MNKHFKNMLDQWKTPLPQKVYKHMNSAYIKAVSVYNKHKNCGKKNKTTLIFITSTIDQLENLGFHWKKTQT